MVVICLLLIFLTGCVEETTEVKKEIRVIEAKTGFDGFILTFCDDKVICYNVEDGYGASGSCFRDEDLVRKYCGGNNEARIELD